MHENDYDLRTVTFATTSADDTRKVQTQKSKTTVPAAMRR